MANVNDIWTASAVQTVNVTVTGTAPFTKRVDNFNGSLTIVSADGSPAKVTRTVDAIEGFSAEVIETANAVFADNAINNALVDEILADANA